MQSDRTVLLHLEWRISAAWGKSPLLVFKSKRIALASKPVHVRFMIRGILTTVVYYRLQAFRGSDIAL
jgi:uncharacterized membrane protein (UPF0136 family)